MIKKYRVYKGKKLVTRKKIMISFSKMYCTCILLWINKDRLEEYRENVNILTSDTENKSITNSINLKGRSYIHRCSFITFHESWRHKAFIAATLQAWVAAVRGEQQRGCALPGPFSLSLFCYNDSQRFARLTSQ